MEPQRVVASDIEDDDDEFADCVKGDSSDDDDVVPLTFKQNVLENIRLALPDYIVYVIILD